MTSLTLTFWLRYDQAGRIGGVAVWPQLLSCLPFVQTPYGIVYEYGNNDLLD